MVLILSLGGTLGTCIIFGVFGSFTLDLMHNGVVDVISYIKDSNPTGLIKEVFDNTVSPALVTIIYLVALILFTVTTLDATSFSLAGITTKKIDKDANISPLLRLFWCLLLTVIPIIFLIIEADLNILKSFPVLIVVPMIPIFTVLGYKVIKYIKEEFDGVNIDDIEKKFLELHNS